jgi:O-antigen/teichoic acid export membrane protein
MKIDFAKNTRRNALAAILNKCLGLLFPFLNRTLFLFLMGPEYLGLNGLFVSILGVLSLADLGFGTAVVCSMYKPIAEDDRALVCAYLRFYRKVYRWAGTAILAAGLCLLPFVRNLVHGDMPPGVDLHVLYLIHLANTAVSYFLFAYRGSVLSAHHRGDVITNIRTFTSIAQYATVFAILFLTRNYYHYVLAVVAYTVLNNLLTVWQAKRLFPDIEPRGDLPSDKLRKVISDVKSIFMHKIGAVISNQADNIVISAFLGLVAVAAYGNYFYVVTSVSGLTWAIYSSMQNGFGNTVFTETKEENFRRFMKALRVVLVVVSGCAAMMTALYQPFIAVWTGGRADMSRHFLTPLLMVLYFYVMQSRQTLLTFKAAANIWREDRWKPLVAGAANLSLNIALVLTLPEEYKLDGVVLSTIVGYVAIQVPWESRVMFSVFFGKAESRSYWRSQALFAVLTAALCAAAWAAARAVPVSGLAGLAIKGVAAGSVVAATLAAFFRRDIASLLRRRR